MVNRSKQAFTLMEMLVVIGILGMLMGVAFSGLGRARARAKVAKANAEVRELVNAILAYEAAEGQLKEKDDAEASGEDIKFLTGGNGGDVYLNVELVDGAFLDPWGRPYRFRIGLGTSFSDSNAEKFSATVTFPNRQRGLK